MLSSIWNGNIIPHPLPPSRVCTLHSRDAIFKIKNNPLAEAGVGWECSKPALLISNPFPVPHRTAHTAAPCIQPYFHQALPKGAPHREGTKPLWSLKKGTSRCTINKNFSISLKNRFFRLPSPKDYQKVGYSAGLSDTSPFFISTSTKRAKKCFF